MLTWDSMSVLHVDPAELHRECTLARRFADQDELLVGQEVGKMAYPVHDVPTAAKVRVLPQGCYRACAR